MYEEVEIPPNEAMPVGFEEKPVYISELDEVSATLFLRGSTFYTYTCICTPQNDITEIVWMS